MLHNSICISGSQPNVTKSIIIWIKFGMKKKNSSIILEYLINSFTCKIHIPCQINLTRQIFIKILTFAFLNIFTLMLATCCSQMIHHAKSCLMGHILASFWSFLMAFVGTTIICWELFSLTWNLFIPRNMVFPHLYSIILFSRIKCISNCDDPRQFKMLFLKCNFGRKPSFYNNAKWKLKQNVPY